MPDLLDVLSDHSPYWVTLCLPSIPSTRIWQLNLFWFTIMSDMDVIQREWVYFFHTNLGSASVREALGLHAHMILSARINRHKASSKLVLQQAEEHLSSLEQVFLTDPSTSNASLVHLQPRLTNQLHFEKAKQGIFF